MLVDSHCHLDYVASCEGMGSLDDIISRARLNDVEHMLCVCVDLSQTKALAEIAINHGCVSISVGVHPTDVESGAVVSVDHLLALADNEKVVAFGETGLDYFRSTDRAAILSQQESLVHHIEAAKEIKKPLIIHARDSFDDIYSLLEKTNAKEVGGVMHCFTGTLDQAKRAIDLGFYISFSGIVTFKNAKELQEVSRQVPLDRILIETDSPYLAPMPFRGKTNQPSYVKYVAEKLADLREDSYASIASATSGNFYRLFNLDRA